jgi:hypothetical protein
MRPPPAHPQLKTIATTVTAAIIACGALITIVALARKWAAERQRRQRRAVRKLRASEDRARAAAAAAGYDDAHGSGAGKSAASSPTQPPRIGATPSGGGQPSRQHNARDAWEHSEQERSASGGGGWLWPTAPPAST